MNTRVEALEAIDHKHDNNAELDKIVTGDVAKWNAAEANAKAHATGLDEAMGLRVKALEDMFGDGEGTVEAQIAAAVAAEAGIREQAINGLQNQIGVASAEGVVATGLHADIEALEGLVGTTPVAEQIAAAVAAEAKIARAAEKDNADAIKAISDDYLKAADKTELEEKITANDNAIKLLTNGASAEEVDGVNDLIQYVKDHGTEVTGMKADIKANADAIGKATEGDTAGTGLYKRIEDAEAAIDTKAAQSDLDDLDDRVEAVELELNTETTGLKARMTQAESDIKNLVGTESVATQISTAIDGALKVDGAEKYALATALNATNIEVAKKANDADLAAIAKTGSTDNLVQGAMVLVFDCGGAV
jgi:hypothetical protein